ncbi:hypothetical protein K525DRAFT_161830, partial [Schizophyllum commune Loenen D]
MVGTRPRSAHTPSARLRESRKDADKISALTGKKRKNPSGPPPAPRASSKAKSSPIEPRIPDGLSKEEIDMILAARGAKKGTKNDDGVPTEVTEGNHSLLSYYSVLTFACQDIHARNMALLAQEFRSDTGAVASDIDVATPPLKKPRHESVGHADDDLFEGNNFGELSSPCYERDVHHVMQVASQTCSLPPVKARIPRMRRMLLTRHSQIEIVETVAPSTPKPKKGKVTINGSFTPRAAVLVAHSKLMARLGVVTDAYPSDTDSAAWVAVGQSVENADEQVRDIVSGAYQRATQDPVRQQNLITYVSTFRTIIRLPPSTSSQTNYGRSGIKTELARKVRVGMKFVLHLGKLDEHVVRTGVIWALKQKNYVFGDLDIADCTNDRSKPFGCAVFEYAIGETCFTTSKANGEAAKYMIHARQIPWNLVALVASMLEHCLKEWATGKHVLVEFTDDIGRAAHARHMEFITKLCRKCPTHMRLVQQKMLYNILRDQEKEYILDNANGNDDDMEGIDCECLEKAAGGSV